MWIYQAVVIAMRIMLPQVKVADDVKPSWPCGDLGPPKMPLIIFVLIMYNPSPLADLATESKRIRCLILFRSSGYQNMQSYGKRSYDPNGSFTIGLVNTIFRLRIVGSRCRLPYPWPWLNSRWAARDVDRREE